jgi:hypothetical protein
LIDYKMPIRVSCACGKPLQVPDAAAGKAVKCPACAAIVRIPAAGGAGSGAALPSKAASASRPQPASSPQRPPAQPAKPPQRASAPQPVEKNLGDLFDEEGFSTTASQVCPACRKEMKPGAVLCTSCGFHVTQGVRFESHKTPGVDIDQGTMALNKAAADLDHAKKIQSDMIDNAGTPPWLLALILTVLAGLAVIGVLAINFSRAAELKNEANTFQFLPTFLFFAAVCFNLAAMMMNLRIIVHAFKSDIVQGLMVLLIPLYIFVYGLKNWKPLGRSLIILVVTACIAGGLYFAANSQLK